MQLVVYMDEAMQLVKKDYPGKVIRPGGFFYYNIKDPYLKKNEGKLSVFSMTGLINKELEKKEPLERTL
jgi:ATP-dependent helicase/DNAse subunit B